MKTNCGAKTRGGGSCTQPAMPNGRCRMHGGKSLSGIASPTFKTGRYSQDLAAAPGLLERFRQEQESGNASHVADEMALLRARAGELLQNLENRVSRNLWAEVAEAFHELLDAMKDKDKDAVSTHLTTLRDLIEKGSEPHEIWEEISAHCVTIAKLARVELQREVRDRETMTARQAMVFKSIIETNLKESITQNCPPELAEKVLASFAGGVRRDIARGITPLPSGD
jgi:hypothetical protein